MAEPFKRASGRTLSTLVLLLAMVPAFAQDGEEAAKQTGSDPTLFWVLTGAAVLWVIVIAVLSNTLAHISATFKDKKSIRDKGPVLLIGLFLSASSVQAQGGAETSTIYGGSALWWLLGINIFLIAIVIHLISTIRGFLKAMGGAKEEAPMAAKKEKPHWLRKLGHQLTKSTPVEREEEVMLAHEHDGIRELDNDLPPWWRWLFYVSIIFSVVYMFHYHVFHTGDLQHEEYRKNMKKAEARVQAYLKKQKLNVDENSVTRLTKDKALAKGKTIYVENCAQCHKKNGGGKIGPNLTDRYWIHGGSIKDIFSTIKYGVVEKGMQSWEDKLSPRQIQQVASYIMSLQGTDPPNAKDPEGELYKPEKAPGDSAAGGNEENTQSGDMNEEATAEMMTEE